MATFTINEDNNITVYATSEEAAQAGDSTAISFDSQTALAKAAADWPLSRLVDIYNSIPGNAEVRKFQDRKKAVARVWKAIQPLVANDHADKPAPVAERPKKGRKQAKVAAKPAKKASQAKQADDKPAAERSNKKAEIIAMMKRAKGATLPEIMAATGWQAHTVRGFVSILGSKGGEKIESSKNAAGERTYKIAR